MKIKGRIDNENESYVKVTIKTNEEKINALEQAKNIIDNLLEKEKAFRNKVVNMQEKDGIE
jgi:acylphosphatase